MVGANFCPTDNRFLTPVGACLVLNMKLNSKTSTLTSLEPQLAHAQTLTMQMEKSLVSYCELLWQCSRLYTMSVWQALPNVTKLSSPSRQAPSQPVGTCQQLIMPASHTQALLCSQPGQIDMTQPYHNNPYYPHLELCLGIKTAMILCKSPLCPYTPTIADLYLRPTADPECPPGEGYTQVSQL